MLTFNVLPKEKPTYIRELKAKYNDITSKVTVLINKLVIFLKQLCNDHTSSISSAMMWCIFS